MNDDEVWKKYQLDIVKFLSRSYTECQSTAFGMQEREELKIL